VFGKTVTSAVSDCRRLVYIDLKPSLVFTTSGWLEALDEKYDAGSARQQTFSRAVETQKGQDPTKEIVTRVQVKVPFKIEKNARHAGIARVEDCCIYRIFFLYIYDIFNTQATSRLCLG